MSYYDILSVSSGDKVAKPAQGTPGIAGKRKRLYKVAKPAQESPGKRKKAWKWPNRLKTMTGNKK